MCRVVFVSIAVFCLAVFSSAGKCSVGPTARPIDGRLLLLVSVPNWPGTFDITPLCDPRICCCLTGSVQIKEKDASTLSIEGRVTGQCQGLTVLSLPFARPSTFSTSLPILGRLNLSDDSSVITADSPLGPQCNGRAVRQ
jgi:hypothetical protein